MTRCRRTDAHRCVLARHLPTGPRERVLPMPAAVAVLCLAVAAFLAAGRWTA